MRARCQRARAEERLARLDAAHEELHVVLPRVADAAVDLDALLGEQALAVAGGGLGHRRRARAAGIVLGDRERREVAERPGALERDHHVGELVLDRLERPDRHAELLALLGVLERGVEDRLRGADHLERDGHGRLLERAQQRRARPTRRDRRARGRAPTRTPSRSTCASRRLPSNACTAWCAIVGDGHDDRAHAVGARSRRRPGRRPRARRPRRLPRRTASCPTSTTSSPSNVIVASTSAGSNEPVASAIASEPVISPAATAPRKRACWSGVPISRTAGTNCETVASSGPGAITRPSSSARIASSSMPEPDAAVRLGDRERGPAEVDHRRPQRGRAARRVSTTARASDTGLSLPSTARIESRSSS